MFRVLSCLDGEHDLGLVLLATVVCFVTSLVAINLFRRARLTTARARVAWIATAATASGCGIWATHFISMLAYEPGVPIAYDMVLTALSLLSACVCMAVGIVVTVHRPHRWGAVLGGTVIGLAVASMHYLGMWAIEVPGRVSWSADLVAVSILLGIVFGIAAMAAATRRDSIAMSLVASLSLTAAILSHHFTAMGAISFVPDPTLVVTPLSIAPRVLALCVAAVTTLVLSIGAVGSIVDQRFSEKSRQFEAALHNMYQGLCILNKDCEVMVVNGRFLEMFDIATNRIVPRMPMAELMDCAEQSVPFGVETRTAIRQWVAELVRGKKSGKTIFRRSDGRIFSISHEYMPTIDGFVETFEDITERRQAEDKIAYMARHDPLTGLPNRMHFRECMDKAMHATGRRSSFAVLCLDLDHFKTVNDTLGQQCGDQFLRIAAARILAAVRETDLVARFSGDEFAILQLAEDQPAAVTALAERLIEVIRAPAVIGGDQILIGVSVGISLAPGDGSEPDQLLNNADMALYRAKADGRGTYRFFEPEMDARMRARRVLELDLRRAVATGGFVLHYQPIVNVATNRVSSFEALLRWPHPTQGLVPPLDFIPLAEETGLIIPIGEWVLRAACAQAVNWPEDVRVAVNLSPLQFKDPNLVTTVVGALSAAGLSPPRLELEITESVLLSEGDATMSTLHQLRTLGVAIVMDDFGTGYSSLSYLRKFPFDKIKIDKTFVHDLAEGGHSLAIVRAVTGLGSSLGIGTIAEGVETTEQLKRLRAEGCSEAQGFLFGAPQPAEEAIRHLAATRQLRVVA